MLSSEAIFGAIHDLSYEDKVKLRALLDGEIKSASPVNGSSPAGRSIIGLFSDEPELMDQVLESVYERRARPLRTEE